MKLKEARVNYLNNKSVESCGKLLLSARTAWLNCEIDDEEFDGILLTIQSFLLLKEGE